MAPPTLSCGCLLSPNPRSSAGQPRQVLVKATGVTLMAVGLVYPHIPVAVFLMQMLGSDRISSLLMLGMYTSPAWYKCRANFKLHRHVCLLTYLVLDTIVSYAYWHTVLFCVIPCTYFRAYNSP